MMISDIYSKWEELVKKYTDSLTISAFYISKVCPSKIYFGFDGKKKIIYLEFTESAIQNFKCPSIKGLNIEICDVPSISNSFKYIQISNVDNKDEVFLAFCSTLHSELQLCTTYFDCAEALIKTLKYYKSYFSNPKKPLSEDEEQGLYCELLYLEKLIEKQGEHVVLNWEGPAKNKRDFVFDDKSIEIKSTSGQVCPSIRISNENQLDSSYPSNINLFLKVYIVEKIDEGDCLSLAGKRIFDKIENISYKQVYLEKLLMDKIDLELYEDINHFAVQKELFYKVNDEFPKITSSKVDKRIFKVEYRISLSNLKEFEAEE